MLLRVTPCAFVKLNVLQHGENLPLTMCKYLGVPPQNEHFRYADKNERTSRCATVINKMQGAHDDEPKLC